MVMGSLQAQVDGRQISYITLTSLTISRLGLGRWAWLLKKTYRIWSIPLIPRLMLPEAIITQTDCLPSPN